MDKQMTRRDFLAVSAMTAAVVALDWKKIAAYAAAAGPVNQYPAVVIGAGLGGLCAAAYLARQGFPVTLLEQHTIPGGYATSFDRKAGKYTFEVSLHGTSINNNAPARILDNLGVIKNLVLVELPEVYRLKTKDLEIIVPNKNPESYIQMLSLHFPHERKGIRGFVEEMIALSDEVETYSRKGVFLKLAFPLQYPKMWAVRNKTLADLLSEHVADAKVRKILAGLWGYFGLPPSQLSGFYYANAIGGYLKRGSYYIKDRSQKLSDLLAAAFEDAGGSILYDTVVDRIVLKDGKVSGVMLADGSTLPARVVVSNASAMNTFNQMLPAGTLSENDLQTIDSYRPSISSFLVWLGLNQPLRGKIPGFSTHVSLGDSVDGDYRACIDGDVENGPFSVSLFDNLYDGYSTTGTSTLQLSFLCGYEPWRRFEASYDYGDKISYHREKDRWTDTLIRRTEELIIPGLRQMIDVKEAATPLTNRRYTGNPAGAIYGYEQSMDNAFMKRIDNRTPVKGLYLASAWGNPGAGYAGVLRAGESAFGKIMEDLADGVV